MKKASNYDIVMVDRIQLVENIVKNLEKGKNFYEQTWDSNMVLAQNPVSNLHYKGGNQLKLMWKSIEKGYKDPRWLTFKQAQANNWKVKKGEKGVLCEKWIYSRIVKEKDEVTGIEKEKNIPLERPVVNFFYVFNAEQIEGISIMEKPSITKDEMYSLTEKVISSSEVSIIENAANIAAYHHKKDVIYLPIQEAFSNNQSFLATALHEMVHSTGHKSRLNRDMSGTFGSESYAKEELVAELGSIFLQGKLGIHLDGKHVENHQGYLQSWIKVLQNDPNELFRAAAKAEKAMEKIFSHYLEHEKRKEKKRKWKTKKRDQKSLKIKKKRKKMNYKK